MRQYLPHFPAHRRKDLAEDISLFLAKVLRVPDEYPD
jgi:hypothetical protein